MPFNSEGTIASLTAAARFVNLVRVSGEFLERLPKVTVTRADPFIYIPSLWIQADRKGTGEADYYHGLDVEQSPERLKKFLGKAGLPGRPLHDLDCTDLGVTAFVSLLTQDPTLYFEFETEDDTVVVENAAAFQAGRCIFLAGYDIGESEWFWLEGDQYWTGAAPEHEVGEADSPIHSALKLVDADFKQLKNVFEGFIPRRPLDDLHRLAEVPSWIDAKPPANLWEWADVFPILASG